jgi:hypothetical protein
MDAISFRFIDSSRVVAGVGIIIRAARAGLLDPGHAAATA